MTDGDDGDGDGEEQTVNELDDQHQQYKGSLSSSLQASISTQEKMSCEFQPIVQRQ